MKTKTRPNPSPHDFEPRWLEVVRENVGEMRFGTIQITIHEGRVTQVDATRRTRLTAEVKVP